MELVVYSLEKKEISRFDVKDEILNTPLHPFLIKDAVVAYQTSVRQGSSSTKGTSQVNGSTKKLYRQKGTGNARAGSKKAIQRRGGAVQFGPKPRHYKLKVNKKAARMALASAFAEAFRKEKLIVVDELKIAEVKSAKVKDILKTWSVKNALMVEKAKFDEKFSLSTRNFSSIKLTKETHLNVYDLLKFNKIFMTQDAVESFCSRFDR